VETIHQQHPHVHLVVKAENELGRRLHIDKQLFRNWREDFAQLIREQGIAANATTRAIRGVNKTKRREGTFKAQHYGKSTVMRKRMIGIATELYRSGTVEGPAPHRLETRKSLVSAWMKAAEVLDTQGEVILAGEVRYFATHLPPVLTDRQRLAALFNVSIPKCKNTLARVAPPFWKHERATACNLAQRFEPGRNSKRCRRSFQWLQGRK